eukprot:3695369-Pleurochrysis_carterae.AAC.1
MGRRAVRHATTRAGDGGEARARTAAGGRPCARCGVPHPHAHRPPPLLFPIASRTTRTGVGKGQARTTHHSEDGALQGGE